jgi:hypothetical protein
LGNGLVLTAAHVVGSAARTRPSVRIAGMDQPAKAIKEGNIERVDLTLLSIDEQKLPIYLPVPKLLTALSTSRFFSACSITWGWCQLGWAMSAKFRSRELSPVETSSHLSFGS